MREEDWVRRETDRDLWELRLMGGLELGYPLRLVCIMTRRLKPCTSAASSDSIRLPLGGGVALDKAAPFNQGQFPETVSVIAYQQQLWDEYIPSEEGI